MTTIAIVGGGFAGVWSALSAARARARAGRAAAAIRIVLLSRDGFLTIRPRLYEAALNGVRVPLDDILTPRGVERLTADVTDIDVGTRTLTLGSGGTLAYDRLILAAGSRLHRPDIPGLAAHAFSVDTYGEAAALAAHLGGLATAGPRAGRRTGVVVGAGFTGLEAATELVTRLRAIAPLAGETEPPAVVLIERAPVVAPELGTNPRPVVERALAALGIRVRVAAGVAAITADGVRLTDGAWIPAATTIWTAGMRASPLTERVAADRDPLGRLAVDEFLRVRGIAGVFAAGDVAHAMADAHHVALMSCQHAIPMGAAAGRNAVAELTGGAPAAFSAPDYVTCLDLGEWGAVFTQGWERQVTLEGGWAKHMKRTINTRLIYPPRADGASADAECRPADAAASTTLRETAAAARA